LDFNQIEHLVEVHKIDEIYLMAALLSATAEKTCFRLGFKYEFFISRFEFGQSQKIKKNILAIEYCCFGPTTPKENTPQYTIMEPSTVYGISKQSGERWCEYP
jgi:nucleoside-diphosphate-sugar epimerase